MALVIDIADYAENRIEIKRNKIKRKIKGSFELNTLNLPPLDYVVFVRRNISSSEDLIKKELTELWDKIRES